MLFLSWSVFFLILTYKNAPKSKSQACYYRKKLSFCSLIIWTLTLIFDVFSVSYAVWLGVDNKYTWLGLGSKNTSLDYNIPLHIVMHMFEV